MWVNTSGQLKFSFGAVADYNGPATTMDANQWWFVAVTVSGNGGTATFYLRRFDAGSFTTGTTTVGTPTGTLSLIEVGHDFFGENFDGLIDEARIYTRELAAADIQDLFDYTGAPAAPQPFHTVGYRLF